ncbi:hypothetical protein CH063_12618 [Colletotrichum higginsianum]|uniref:Carrier domain-containing protein n=1 Tax=Colletotrichum higginsianum (strain IMI 349063) TaxID=759273 RepID=H1VR36_COLHI|nr:hypothetical protein CH063_12618 [Colletotrichum higginsianum]
MANSVSPKHLPRIDTSMVSFHTESVEDRLISAAASVLNLPKNSIELFDSFCDLGGDRPSAVALKKRCMSLGLGVRTSDILRCHTLAELQTCITPLVVEVQTSQETTTTTKERLLNNISFSINNIVVIININIKVDSNDNNIVVLPS